MGTCQNLAYSTAVEPTDMKPRKIKHVLSAKGHKFTHFFKWDRSLIKKSNKKRNIIFYKCLYNKCSLKRFWTVLQF